MDPLVLRKKLSAGQTVLTSGVSASSLVLIDAASKAAGVDGLMIDLQHGAATETDLIASIQAMRAGTAAPVVRVGWNDPHHISRALDAGALAIICPMTNTKEDVERFVGASRYFPLGYRSYGPYCGNFYENYAEVANDAVITLAMVETTTALDNLEEMLTVPGLDGIFIGQTDLSITMGFKPRPDWRDDVVHDATIHVLNTAKAAGKIAGIMAATPSFAREMVQAGFNFVSQPGDGLLRGAIEASIAETRRP